MPLFADTANKVGMNSLRMAGRRRNSGSARSRANTRSRTNRAHGKSSEKRSVSALWQDWMRWRRPETAIEELMNPEVLQGLGGLPITITPPGSKPQSDPISDKINIPINTTPGDIRHELWHFTLSNLSDLAKQGVMPESLKNLSPKYKLAARVGPQFVGEALAQFANLYGLKNYLIDINESGAITFGGAGAYPNLMPAFNPQDFGDIFNTNSPTWNY